MTTSEVVKLLECNERQVRKYKGQFRYHVSYFYRFGITPEGLVNRVKLKIPSAVITDSGDHDHSFDGGSKSGSAKDSFMWVTFTV